MDIHHNIHKLQRKSKYMNKLSTINPNSKQNHPHSLVNYLLEDHTSLKFWNLVEHVEKPKEEAQSITQYEQMQVEKKNKFNHILPMMHSTLSLYEFLQYFHKNHVKNLEKSFIALAKKDITETEKEIYITQESL